MSRLTDAQLLDRVRQCLASPPLVEALVEFLRRDDDLAVAVIRSNAREHLAEAEEILRSNERLRHLFRQALDPKDKDPFACPKT